MTQLFPEVTLDLDYGVFLWLWRLIEAKKRHADIHYVGTQPEYHDLLDRAQTQFKAALGAKIEKAEQVGKTNGKRVIRRPEAGARTIKRRG